MTPTLERIARTAVEPTPVVCYSADSPQLTNSFDGDIPLQWTALDMEIDHERQGTAVASKNERKTENIARDALRRLG